ncbi:hypothetical protein K438DRAFT_1987629 [Mycena galopus ATCC 62051]|nr:hypothetical protein K438DRAFT_1987629 [Mycena galopus ATCC 62051]
MSQLCEQNIALDPEEAASISNQKNHRNENSTGAPLALGQDDAIEDGATYEITSTYALYPYNVYPTLSLSNGSQQARSGVFTSTFLNVPRFAGFLLKSMLARRRTLKGQLFVDLPLCSAIPQALTLKRASGVRRWYRWATLLDELLERVQLPPASALLARAGHGAAPHAFPARG